MDATYGREVEPRRPRPPRGRGLARADAAGTARHYPLRPWQRDCGAGPNSSKFWTRRPGRRNGRVRPHGVSGLAVSVVLTFAAGAGLRRYWGLAFRPAGDDGGDRWQRADQQRSPRASCADRPNSPSSSTARRAGRVRRGARRTPLAWWTRRSLDDVLPRPISRSCGGAGHVVDSLDVSGRPAPLSSRAGLRRPDSSHRVPARSRLQHFGVTDVPMTFMVPLAFFATISMPAGPGALVARGDRGSGLWTGDVDQADARRTSSSCRLAIAVWQRGWQPLALRVNQYRRRICRRISDRDAVRADRAAEVRRGRARPPVASRRWSRTRRRFRAGAAPHLLSSLRPGLPLLVISLVRTALAG